MTVFQDMVNSDLLLQKRIEGIKEEVNTRITKGEKKERALNEVLKGSCVSVIIKQQIRKSFN